MQDKLSCKYQCDVLQLRKLIIRSVFMKKTKKLLSLLLAIIMLFSITAGIDLSAYATENDVTSISLKLTKPIEIIENSVGEWTYDENNKKYFEYDRYSLDILNEGDELTVNYNNSSSIKYSYQHIVTDDFENYGWVSSGGEILDSGYYYDNQYQNHWTLESDNYLMYCCMGKETQIPVTIIESPIKSISYTPIKPIELIQGVDTNPYMNSNDEIYDSYINLFMDAKANVGDILTVNYKDGKSKDFVFFRYYDEINYCTESGYKSDDGEIISGFSEGDNNLSLETDILVLGSNICTLRYLGVETTVEIVVKNEIASVKAIPVSSLELRQGLDSYEDYDYETGEYYDWYFYRDFFLEITYSNGETSIFKEVPQNEGYLFEDEKGRYFNVNFFSDQQKNHWKIGEKHEFIIAISSSAYTTIPVTIVEKSAPCTTHIWDNGKVTKTATCTATGVKTYTCTKCGETKTETIKATGHKAVTDKAVAATCTTAGKTAGSHCSVCNTVITAQKTIPATGHSYDAGKITKAATATATGVKTYTCTKCKATKTETIPALGLKAPTLKVTVNSNGTFKLSWNKVTGATRYGIYMLESNGKYKWIKSTSATNWTTGVAQYGKKYTYKVFAVDDNTSAKSAFSSAVSATNKKKLQAPTAKVTVNSNGSFKLSWNKVTGATKYGIYMKQTNGSYKWIKTVTGTSWSTATAQYGKQYSYKVLAANNNKSAQTFSNVVTAKNTKKLTTPTLKATVNKNGSFKLSWGKVTGATSYQIYMKQSNGSY